MVVNYKNFGKKMSNQQIIPTMLNLIVHKLADTHYTRPKIF